MAYKSIPKSLLEITTPDNCASKAIPREGDRHALLPQQHPPVQSLRRLFENLATLAIGKKGPDHGLNPYSRRMNDYDTVSFGSVHSASLDPGAVDQHNLAFGSKRPIDDAGVKAKLDARGVGHGVRVTFADNTEAKGLIVSLGDQGFSLQGKGDERPREISYTQVTGVHNSKLSTGAKVGIGVAVAGVAILIVALVLRSRIWGSGTLKTGIPIS